MDKNNFTVEDVYELAVTMSEKGEYNEAFKCYSYTAERGHLSGQFNLAYCSFMVKELQLIIKKLLNCIK